MKDAVAERDIRPRRPEDASDLAVFLARMYGPASRQGDAAYEAWRGPETWVCQRDGGVVGVQSGLGVTVEFAGTPIAAHWAVDLMIAPEWRMRGIFSPLTEAFLADKALVMGLGVSEGAHRAYLRSGWADLGIVPRYLRLLKPLESKHYGGWLPSRAQIALSAVAAPLLRLRDSAVIAWTLCRGIRWHPIPNFGSWADDIWAAARPHYQAIARRDAAALQHRFDGCPHSAQYQRFVLLQDSRPVGYAVLRPQTDGAMAVVDHLCAPEFYPALLAHCLDYAAGKGAWSLACLASHQIPVAAMRRAGFLRRNGPRFMTRSTTPLAPTEQGHWFLSMADSDLDH